MPHLQRIYKDVAGTETLLTAGKELFLSDKLARPARRLIFLVIPIMLIAVVNFGLCMRLDSEFRAPVAQQRRLGNHLVGILAIVLFIVLDLVTVVLGSASIFVLRYRFFDSLLLRFVRVCWISR
jgi:hypothetical protein